MLSDHQVLCRDTDAPTSTPRGGSTRMYSASCRARRTRRAIFYDAGGGTYFVVTRSAARRPGSHTQMGFRVTDIDSEVADLQRRGVTFEEYETPKTVDGIATIPIGRTAWFRDPEGNIIGMLQFND